jgi:hypothetical protein
MGSEVCTLKYLPENQGGNACCVWRARMGGVFCEVGDQKHGEFGVVGD